MTQRRRFFPSTTVQTVPGRTVEFGVMLRPEPVVPEPVVPEPQLSWTLNEILYTNVWQPGAIEDIDKPPVLDEAIVINQFFISGYDAYMPSRHIGFAGINPAPIEVGEDDWLPVLPQPQPGWIATFVQLDDRTWFPVDDPVALTATVFNAAGRAVDFRVQSDVPLVVIPVGTVCLIYVDREGGDFDPEESITVFATLDGVELSPIFLRSRPD